MDGFFNFLGWIGDQWWFWVVGGMCCMGLLVLTPVVIILIVLWVSKAGRPGPRSNGRN